MTLVSHSLTMSCLKSVGLPRLGQLDAGMGSLFGSRGPAAACPTPLAIAGDARCMICICNVLRML